MAPSRRKGDAKGSGKGDGRKSSTPAPPESIASLVVAPVSSQRLESQRLEDVAPEAVRQPSVPFTVVCVGASAGGRGAFTQLCEAMATNTRMALLLVSHPSRSPGRSP